jgi:PAS domain S-box-containing protein
MQLGATAVRNETQGSGLLVGRRLEKLTDHGDLALFRAVADQDKQSSFLVLAPQGPLSMPETLARLQHVHALREELDATWATTPRELVEQDGQPLLLLEDPSSQGSDAMLLSHSVGTTFELGTLLRVARGIAAALARLHARGLVHKDIRPSNVFVSMTDGRAWLTSFAIASRLPRERQSPVPPEVIAGTFAYMSPEQTGRMNRSIDSRSDLYSLGVTLHELATGALPFRAQTPLEWIHCHIAREPVLAADSLPAQLRAIIEKLLAKNAEDRYQTAAGVAADLQRCVEQIDASGGIASFALGQKDAPDHLLIPEKLYGRDRDVAAITAALERVVATGIPEVVLVAGYSGIGKSSVVSELHKLLAPVRGLFATGKFDQRRRDVPYSTLAQALQGILHEILGKSDAELAAWREHLLEAVGRNGQLLFSLLPQLALVIGEQPAVPELPPQEAKGRFQRVLRSLIGAFASKHGALALFLDDLQWVDAATLEFLETLFTDTPVQKLLLIGAYRDNEVGSDHALASAIARFRQRRAALTSIVLGPLSAGDVEQLVSDALRARHERVAPLSRLIHDKTGGNPFFVIEFLTGLVDEGLVTYDAARAQWAWDAERILAKTFTENVVHFMVEKLGKLPEKTQLALRLLACLGNVTPLATLGLVHGQGLDEAMWAAVRAGLVCRTDGCYGFLHDRVQEAAYALLPEEERASTHLRIARRLAERLPHEERQQALFDLVNQFNRALPLLASADERRAVAELNLTAGRRARAAAAYASAEIFFAAGRQALGDRAWESERALVFELELRRAESEMLIASLTSADQRLDLLWQRAIDSVERAAVTCLRILRHQTVHHLNRCLGAGLQYLETLGTSWPEQPSQEDVGRELAALWAHIGDRSIDQLLDLPSMTDAVSRGTMDVLAGMLGPAYSYSPTLMVLCVAHMTRLSIEQGNTDASVLAYAFLAVIIIGPRGPEYRKGHRFGQLAMDLVHRRGLVAFKGRAGVVFAAGVLHWTRHLAEGKEVLRQAIEACTEVGDIGYACYGGYLRVAARLGSGDPLDEVQREAEEVVQLSQKAGFSVGVEFVGTQLALIRALHDSGSSLGKLADEEELEQRYEQALGGVGVKEAQNVMWVQLYKLQARLMAGEIGEACAAAEKARTLQWCCMERFELAEFHFYSALAHAADGAVDVVRDHRDQLASWAADCSENFSCRHVAVEAELARLEGRELDAERLYERALGLARDQGFVQVEALIAELAARFHATRGLDIVADAYLSVAHEAYLRWGATAKVRQLAERFPKRCPGGRDVSAPRSVELSVGDLDLATVVNVSHAISAEIMLDRLVQRIMTIAIESAGAQRGLLIVPREGELVVEADAVATASGVEVRISPAAASSQLAPVSILRYVARTLESVVLSDASQGPGPYVDDAYVRATQARSVLCVPLVKQARLIGVLYLENNLLAQVFTPRRIASLDLVASQAAISLENARLHGELRTAQSDLRDALRENRLLNDAIPGLSWCSKPDGSAELFNQPWTDYTGLTQENSVGWGWTAALHPDDAQETQLRWQAIREAGEPAELELRIRRHDGAYRWFLVHVRPLLDDNGRVVRWYGTNLDIEELRRAQDELRRNEGFLATGQRLSATGSYLWRPDTGEITFSDELCRIFGFAPDTEVTFAEIFERLHPDDRGIAAQNVELSRRGLSHEPYEIRLRLPDGTLKHVQNSVHQTRDRDGRQEVMGVMQDITERRLAEQAVSKVRSELANMTRIASLGTLTAAIAHEINQPLAAVMLNAGAGLRMLSGDTADIAGLRETVQRTLRDAKRAGDVIERLRALFSKKDLCSEAVDLNEATREVIALCLSDLQRNRVSLRTELSDALPPLIADRIQLQQVIQNLLLNASQAMLDVGDRPRQLLVQTARDADQHLRLTVKDVGVGLEGQDISKLFEPFHTTKKTGMGIGLAISRSIIENHGGRLWATPNDDGPGSSFSFSIPTQTRTA